MASVISLVPDAFIQGGLLNDVDVEISEIQFCGWDYDGAVGQDVLAVKASLTILDENGRPDPQAVTDQYWSAGGNFDPAGVSEDGYTLLPTQTKTALTKGSNFHYLLQSLWANGMPQGYLEDGNLSRLKGVRVHVIRTAVKREGLTNTSRRGDRESNTLVCNRILWGPWDKKATAGGQSRRAPAQSQAQMALPGMEAGGAESKPNGVAHTNGAVNGGVSAPAAVSASPEVEGIAVQSVAEALNVVDGHMFGSVKDLKVAVFRRHSKDKADVRNQIVKLVEDVAWLEAHGFAVVDGAVIGQA